MKHIRLPLLALSAISLIWIGCTARGEQLPPQDEIPVVETAPVQRMSVPLVIRTSGQLASKAEVRLSFKISGIVARIQADDGQHVRQGQLLAQLDQEEIAAQVRQANSAYAKAERDLERTSQLYNDKVGTLEQVQDLETALDVAASQKQIAEFNQRHAAIYAPASGRILKRFIEQGELIAPGTPAFLFGSTAQDWVLRVGLVDREVVRLQLGDSASVHFDAYPGKSLAAEVSEIAGSADPMTGTYEVELRIDPKGKRLLSGFIAHADIVPGERPMFDMVPVDALVEMDGYDGFVYTLDADGLTARRIPVRIGRLFNDAVGIVQGLENVDRVITAGAPYVQDGARVQVADTSPLPNEVAPSTTP